MELMTEGSDEGMITTIELRKEPAWGRRDTVQREWYINQKGRVMHIVYHQRGKKIQYRRIKELLMPGTREVLCTEEIDERALGVQRVTFRGASLRGLEQAAAAWGRSHPDSWLCLWDPDARYYFTAEKLFREGIQLKVVTSMTNFYTRMAQKQAGCSSGKWQVTDSPESAGPYALLLHPERITAPLPTLVRVFTLYQPACPIPNPVCTHFLPPAEEAVLSLKPPGVDTEAFLNMYEYSYPKR